MRYRSAASFGKGQENQNNALREPVPKTTELIWAEYSLYIKIHFEVVDAKQVCLVDKEQSATPAYYRDSKCSELKTPALAPPTAS